MDKNRFATPLHRNPLTKLDRAKVQFDRCQCQDIGGRIEIVDQRPHHRPRAHGGRGPGEKVEKVTPEIVAGSIFNEVY